MSIEGRLKELGLELPQPMVLPAGVTLPFSWVRLSGNRAYVSGHLPLKSDGTLAEPVGKVGSEVSVDQAYEAAKLTGLSLLGSLQRELGTLDRVESWLRVFGMVNVAPGFNQLPAVINGFSELILDVYGQSRGQHARAAVGMAELPFGVSVEVEAEVLIKN